jgi:hypothetical protein
MNSLMNLLLLGQMTERKEAKKDSREVTVTVNLMSSKKHLIEGVQTDES